MVNVMNTGRCRELLLPGAEVILEDCIEKNQNRKTRYDMIVLNQSMPLETAGWISIWKKESKNI